jgi:hypothetical protein
MKFDLGTVASVAAAGGVVLAGLHTLNLYYHMEAVTLCHPATWCAKKFLKTVRTEKFDKECVCATALQKCGSTLLCYIISLVNSDNKIKNFRNDFDILPMLSFPTKIIPQNFNQRQEGKYQLYKINGRLIDVEKDLNNKYHHIFLCRDMNGYFCSLYWWVLAFYPTCDPIYHAFKLVPFELFKYMFYHKAAKDHINEMFHVYTMLQSGTKFMYMVSYDKLVKDKEFEINKLAKAMGITLSQADVEDISNKTSKKSMLEYDRFNPVTFGDGEGVGKVNLEPHSHKLNETDLAWYDAEFKRKFAGTGIVTYADFCKHINSVNK